MLEFEESDAVSMDKAKVELWKDGEMKAKREQAEKEMRLSAIIEVPGKEWVHACCQTCMSRTYTKWLIRRQRTNTA